MFGWSGFHSSCDTNGNAAYLFDIRKSERVTRLSLNKNTWSPKRGRKVFFLGRMYLDIGKELTQRKGWYDKTCARWRRRIRICRARKVDEVHSCQYPLNISPPSSSRAEPKKSTADSIVGRTVGEITLLTTLNVAFHLYCCRKNRQLRVMARYSLPRAELHSPLPIYGHGTADSAQPLAFSRPFYDTDHEH